MNLFTADVGQGKVHVYDSDNDQFHGKLPQENLIYLNIPGLQRGDKLVVECAHLRESHKLTLAQPFDFEQLEELKRIADEKGITILLFPQKSTPKARKLAGVEVDDKTDEVDTKAIAQFLLNDQNAYDALKEFSPKRLETFQEENSDIVEYIQQCNADISPAKSCEYGFGKIDYQDEVSKWANKYLLKITEYLDGDEELINHFGIKILRNGTLKVDKANRIYTLVHSILRPNGELRVRPDIGKVPNWKYIKAHYLGCKPYHMNQGVAASNYKHWWRRAASEYAFPGKKSANTTDFQVGMPYKELAKLKEARTKCDKMTQKIWYALRKMIVEDGLR